MAVNLFKAIVDSLNEEEKVELIRDMFHKSDIASDYFFYEFAPKMCPEIVEKYNIRRDTPTETFFYNMVDKIRELGESWEKMEEVEVIDNFEVYNNTLTFNVLTLTACSDPKVNYYDNGEASILAFIEELKDIFQIDNIIYIEDWDFDEECGTPHYSGEIIITIGGR